MFNTHGRWKTFAFYGVITGAILSFELPVPQYMGSSLAIAGEFNEKISIGAASPSLMSLVGMDGKAFDTSSIPEDAIVVVFFTCNTCPYANDYETRVANLQEFYRKNGQSVEFLAINSNDIEGDSLAAMRERAEKMKYPYDYVKDEGQKVATLFGASKTPEFFVLNRERKIVYMGAFDDSPDGAKITEKYVEQAIAQVLAGEEVKKSETPPIGCRIRAKRERRSRD